MTFGARLAGALESSGPLCVGIDPHATLLEHWDLPLSAAGAEEFGLRVVAAAHGRVGVVKPQVAFYERFGSAGFAALEKVLHAAREADLLVIGDAKRGDIGSTMTAYAEAWLSPGSPLEVDALTVSPYLGPDSLEATSQLALRNGKGLFVLAATSNPDAPVVQAAAVAAGRTADESVAARIVRAVRASEDAAGVTERLRSVGVVVGATVDRADVRVGDELLLDLPILAPGFGAQGAVPADLPRLFGGLSRQVIASESRSILSAGPAALVERITRRGDEYRGLHV